MKPTAVLLFLSIWLVVASSFAGPVKPINEAAISHQSTQVPIAFTKNMGQWPDSVLYRASAGGAVMWFTQDGIYSQFSRRISPPHSREGGNPDLSEKFRHEQDSIETTMIKAQFVGANPRAEVVGLEELDYKCNYFIGNDPAKWHSDVPNYAALAFNDIYPGFTVVFHGRNGHLDYEMNRSTGTRTNLSSEMIGQRVQEVLSQVESSLVISTLKPASALPDNIVLGYSTYLGGNYIDYAYGIAVDDSGCAYVTGYTYSGDFPTYLPYQPGKALIDDAFVSKVSSDGNSLIYSTYLGGNSADHGEAIVVDKSGCSFLTGYTAATDFPTQSPFQVDPGDSTRDAFIVKLSESGASLIYSSYLGGSADDEGRGITLDDAGHAYVTGTTFSPDFPTSTPYQTDQGAYDAFVSKVSPAGDRLVYSTYLGGSNQEVGNAIALDDSANAYVTGYTYSSDFPTRKPYQTYQGAAICGCMDVFVTKLAANGDSVVYSTYLGGRGSDEGCGIKVDAQGSTYIAGKTESYDFPVKAPYQPYHGSLGVADAFITKLAPEGDSLVYSTCLGGTGTDVAYAIALDSLGNTYVTGSTNSSDFPTYAALQATHSGTDAFVTELTSAGSTVVFSSYLGGTGSDIGYGITVDNAGCAYIAGYTTSSNFPVQGHLQVTKRGGPEGFVTKLSLAPPPCCTGTTGNVNMAGIVDLSDLSLLVGYLTITPPPVLLCTGEANINTTDIIDLSDLTLLVSYLTVQPPPVLPNCP